MVKVVRVKPKVEDMIKSGRLTLYNKWVVDDGGADTGDEVLIETMDRKPIGIGIYDGIGPVSVRILSIDKIAPISDIIKLNLKKAYIFRERLGWDSYRLINSEGDHMPGLIVDVYNDIAVIQSGSGGFDQYLDYIASILVREDIVKRVYVKNTQRSRKEVGLKLWSGWIYGRGDTTTIIREKDARFIVDIEEGQKTGFFLDQRMNRLETRLYSINSKVLDLFSYTGGFGIHALRGGAKKCLFIEEDKKSAEVLYENLRLNSLENKADIYIMRVEEFFKENKTKFNLVISDPPALIQSRRNIIQGLEKYREILTHIIKLIDRESILFYSSCSYFLKAKDLINLVEKEFRKSNLRYLYLGRIRGASPDHVHRHEDELNYLKSVFIRIF